MKATKVRTARRTEQRERTTVGVLLRHVPAANHRSMKIAAAMLNVTLEQFVVQAATSVAEASLRMFESARPAGGVVDVVSGAAAAARG